LPKLSVKRIPTGAAQGRIIVRHTSFKLSIERESLAAFGVCVGDWAAIPQVDIEYKTARAGCQIALPSIGYASLGDCVEMKLFTTIPKIIRGWCAIAQSGIEVETMGATLSSKITHWGTAGEPIAIVRPRRATANQTRCWDALLNEGVKICAERAAIAGRKATLTVFVKEIAIGTVLLVSVGVGGGAKSGVLVDETALGAEIARIIIF